MMILGTGFLNIRRLFIQKKMSYQTMTAIMLKKNIYAQSILMPAADDKCYKKYALNTDIFLFPSVHKKEKSYHITELSSSVSVYNIKKFFFLSFCMALNAFTGKNRKIITGFGSQNKFC